MFTLSRRVMEVVLWFLFWRCLFDLRCCDRLSCQMQHSSIQSLLLACSIEIHALTSLSPVSLPRRPRHRTQDTVYNTEHSPFYCYGLHLRTMSAPLWCYWTISSCQQLLQLMSYSQTVTKESIQNLAVEMYKMNV